MGHQQISGGLQGRAKRGLGKKPRQMLVACPPLLYDRIALLPQPNAKTSRTHQCSCFRSTRHPQGHRRSAICDQGTCRERHSCNPWCSNVCKGARQISRKQQPVASLQQHPHNPCCCKAPPISNTQAGVLAGVAQAQPDFPPVVHTAPHWLNTNLCSRLGHLKRAPEQNRQHAVRPLL